MRHFLNPVTVGCFALLLSWGPAHAQVEQLDNLVVVLDASGSMDEEMGSGADRVRKMDAAKQALKQVLSSVPDATNVGVLVFPHGKWAYDLGPRDTERLYAAIDRIKPGGKTPLGTFIKHGADRLLEQRREQLGLGSYRLLIITDGEAHDPERVERFTPDVMSRGIRVDVIGVDMGSDHTLATVVHSYRRADDSAELFRAIREVVAEVTATEEETAEASDAEGDAFELVAGLPEDLVPEIIAAFAATGNHPIGEPPPKIRPQDTARFDPAPAPPSDPPPRKAGKKICGSAGIGLAVLAGMLVFRKRR
jgi:hypothetical protein